MEKKIQRLKCCVQKYDWGILGSESRVARLHSLNSGSAVEEHKPYAEFWMGTHASAPSFLVQSSTDNGVSVDSHQPLSLKTFISQNPAVLGDKVLRNWGSDLPFLFKVLSVAKALSIQAHPDKKLARVLHTARPDMYKDDNHKPEMALALTKFEALCGFIPLEELKEVFCNVPEVVELVGSTNANQLLHVEEKDGEERVRALLQSAFTQLISASTDVVSGVISRLKGRLASESKVRKLSEKERLVLQLEKQYPSDVGVMSAFLFNYVKLNPGEALYLGANEPHAYICGECMEIMATSDNVVRAGLTPKHRDVPTLCSMLTYKQGCPDILPGVPSSPYMRKYLPPFDEFEVEQCLLPNGASSVFPASPGPSIIVVISGEGRLRTELMDGADAVTEGDVLFSPANVEITVTSSSELHLYRAGVSSRFLLGS
ncbi:Phosphomannose isomerase type I, catalytic domain [Dillenia turbinata]|uniref:mannose-6-phosphate isomerase n=1 Tax=Dillenia turbinata TaxID=194707 RepID=A0AAN8V713_9MAGN